MTTTATDRLAAADAVMATYDTPQALKLLADVLYGDTPDSTGKIGLRFDNFLFDAQGVIRLKWRDRYLAIQQTIQPGEDGIAMQSDVETIAKRMIEQYPDFANAVVKEYNALHPIRDHDEFLATRAKWARFELRNPQFACSALRAQIHEQIGTEASEIDRLNYLAKHLVYIDGNPMKGLRKGTTLITADGTLAIEGDNGQVVHNRMDTLRNALGNDLDDQALLGLTLADMATSNSHFRYVLDAVFAQARQDYAACHDPAHEDVNLDTPHAHPYLRELPNLDSFEASVRDILERKNQGTLHGVSFG